MYIGTADTNKNIINMAEATTKEVVLITSVVKHVKAPCSTCAFSMDVQTILNVVNVTAPSSTYRMVKVVASRTKKSSTDYDREATAHLILEQV